jgi:cell division protein FtsB
MNARNILIAIAILLALGLGYSYYWGLGLKGQTEELTGKNNALKSELGEMAALKEDLASEVDSLQRAYNLLAEENTTLQGDLETSREALKRRDYTIKTVKAENSQTEQQLSGLRAEIQALLASRIQLESSIKDLQMQNDSLRNRTTVLETDLGVAREDNAQLANLNRSIQEEVGRLTLENFKASAFRVEPEKKRGDKVTAKSRRTKKINASFDLANVPEKYHGVRPIYMVISDDKGTPIKLDNPINATVSVNGQAMNIQAAESKEVNISTSQRISFKHELSEKLKAGFYRVSVYTDIGLLGASSFKLESGI